MTAEVDGKRVSAVRLVALREDVKSPRLSRILLLLFGAVALTWLVVCANLSNLLLARGPARAAELTIRFAIGATRGRIVRQLLCESAVLAAPGGMLGILLASAAANAIEAAGSVGTLHASQMELTSPVLAFAVLLTVASALVCGILPALTNGRAQLTRGSGMSVGRSARRWSSALVAAEIAIGLVVLVAATALVKSAWRINDVDLGFDGGSVLTFRVTLPVATYGSTTSIEAARYVPAQRALIERLSSIPGVERVSLGGSIFLPGMTGRSSISF